MLQQRLPYIHPQVYTHIERERNLSCGKGVWMARHKRSHSTQMTSGSSASLLLEDYFLARPADDEDDEDILLMTDAEKAAFAEMQSKLEEEHLSRFYHNHYYSNSQTREDRMTHTNSIDGDWGRFGESESVVHRLDKSSEIRLASARSVPAARRKSSHTRKSVVEGCSPFVCQSSQRSREWQVQKGDPMADELTFRPEINASNVKPRYMDDYFRKTQRVSPHNDATVEGSNFEPIVNPLRSSLHSDRLNRYLCMPVHERLGSMAFVSGSDKLLQRRQEREERKKKMQSGSLSSTADGDEFGISELFLRRLEESNRRRENNLERIATMHKKELTFQPVLAPGTRRTCVPSVVAAHIRGETATKTATSARAISSLSGDNVSDSIAKSTRGHEPQINAKSRAMKRSLRDLRLFELRRQQRLQQLRAEQDLACREALVSTPAISTGTQRLAQRMFSGNVTHDVIQRHLQQHAHTRAAAIRAEYDARQRVEERDFTFRPEVHSAPPYVREIAREISVNKSLAPKAPKPKPTFRFS